MLKKVEASSQLLLVVVLDEDLEVLHENSAKDIVEKLGDICEAVQDPQDL
jgi:hypothetical protein